MHEKDGVKAKFTSFAEDKGFYIILMLCVIAIGISGYVLFFLPEAEQNDIDLSLEPGLPSAADTMPDNTPEIPGATVRLEPEPEIPRETPTAAPAVPEVPAETPVEPADEAAETWLFHKKPTYLWPVSGEILRGFSIDALVYDETMGDWRTHNGVDISCAPGDTVRAVADGTVEDVFEDSLLGTVMIISHADGVTSMYCGLAAETAAAAGDAVEAGQAIGTARNTNKTESQLACHIHLAMRQNDGYIDPQSLKFE